MNVLKMPFVRYMYIMEQMSLRGLLYVMDVKQTSLVFQNIVYCLILYAKMLFNNTTYKLL